jgi:2-phosphoglycerate kinase
MADAPEALLIGGTSHVGKSTLARALAARLGWDCRSTDRLARHPGRPWREPPGEVSAHVAEHYLSLTTDELLDDVLRHYRANVWPLVEEMVKVPGDGGLVLEGSAILPEPAAARGSGAVWLTASNDLLERRIYDSSRYETKSEREKEMIDAFLKRTWLFNDWIMGCVRRLGLPSVDVEEASSMDKLVERCLTSWHK